MTIYIYVALVLDHAIHAVMIMCNENVKIRRGRAVID